MTEAKNAYHDALASLSVTMVTRLAKEFEVNSKSALIESIFTIDSCSDQADKNDSYAKGTGEWFLKLSEFKEWINGTKKILHAEGDRKSQFCLKY